VFRRTFAAPVAALIGGVLTTLTIVPFGWWPLVFPGIALLYVSLVEATTRQTFIRALIWGLGLYGPSLFWMTVFSLPGGLFVGILEAVITALTITVLVRTRTPISTLWSLVGALMIADELRSLWPLGGLPLGGIDLGQANGPVANILTLAGRIGLIGTVALGGSALGFVVLTKRWMPATVMIIATTAIIVGSTVIFHVSDTIVNAPKNQVLTVALVQGGGPRGQRATKGNADRTWQAHLAASALISRPIDLIIWPENTVVEATFQGSEKAATLAQIARDHHCFLSVGITENAGGNSFTNTQVMMNPNGDIIDRFDKVRRVPYGEYFPLRSIISNFAELPARDAVAGRGPGVLHFDRATLAVLISYEGFFDDRVRGGVRAGGQVVIIPTNSSSYKRDQLPEQQVASAQLRALESRRTILQVGPTGVTAEIDPNGHIRSRSVIGARSVTITTVRLRNGLTPYVRFNDAPALIAAALAIIVGTMAALIAQRRKPTVSSMVLPSQPHD
jgi:apolipoprotein N-acyltransferase